MGVRWLVHTLFFLSLLPIICFLERERRHKRGREKGQERIPSSRDSPCTSTEPDAGLNLMNHEIMTWAEIKSRLLNRLSYPGASRVPFKQTPCFRVGSKLRSPHGKKKIKVILINYVRGNSVLFNWCLLVMPRLGVSEDVCPCQAALGPRKEISLGGSPHLWGVVLVTWSYHTRGSISEPTKATKSGGPYWALLTSGISNGIWLLPSVPSLVPSPFPHHLILSHSLHHCTSPNLPCAPGASDTAWPRRDSYSIQGPSSSPTPPLTAVVSVRTGLDTCLYLSQIYPPAQRPFLPVGSHSFQESFSYVAALTSSLSPSPGPLPSIFLEFCLQRLQCLQLSPLLTSCTLNQGVLYSWTVSSTCWFLTILSVRFPTTNASEQVTGQAISCLSTCVGRSGGDQKRHELSTLEASTI